MVQNVFPFIEFSAGSVGSSETQHVKNIDNERNNITFFISQIILVTSDQR